MQAVPNCDGCFAGNVADFQYAVGRYSAESWVCWGHNNKIIAKCIESGVNFMKGIATKGGVDFFEYLAVLLEIVPLRDAMDCPCGSVWRGLPGLRADGAHFDIGASG